MRVINSSFKREGCAQMTYFPKGQYRARALWMKIIGRWSGAGSMCFEPPRWHLLEITVIKSSVQHRAGGRFQAVETNNAW